MAVSLYDGWFRVEHCNIEGWRTNRQFVRQDDAIELAARVGGAPVVSEWWGNVPAAWAVFVAGFHAPPPWRQLMEQKQGQGHAD